MRKMTLTAFAVLISSLANAQEVPTSNPSEVYVKGRIVSHSWRDGRIWVPTSDLAPLLNVSSDTPSMDLLKTLEAKGGYVWSIKDERFEAKQDASGYRPSATARQVQSSQYRGQAIQSVGRQAAAPAGRLTYQVKRFTADTGYVRAYVLVTNEGTGPSDPSTMVCQFQDGFGHSYAVDKKPIGPLQPGESQEFEAFSMVEAKDTSMTPTADNLAVNFFSLTNPNSNPSSAKEMRKQAKAGKKTNSGSTLDFNAGYDQWAPKPYRP